MGRSDRNGGRGDPVRAADLLSARERDIFALLSERHTNKEIATRLRLEVQTVKYHVGRVLRKLGMRSRFDLARLEAERRSG